MLIWVSGVGEDDAIEEGRVKILELRMRFQYIFDNDLNILMMRNLIAFMSNVEAAFLSGGSTDEEKLFGVKVRFEVYLDLSLAEVLHFIGNLL